MDAICGLFLLCSLYRLSFVSFAFVFNASLNDVTPVSPMWFPVYFFDMNGKELVVDGCNVLFLLCSLYRLRVVSVVFDFSASLNDVAPVALMLFTVDSMLMGNG